MENFGPEYGRFSARDSSIVSNTGGGGVCLMSSIWKDEQHPSFIQFISSFLRENSIRLNFVPIPADFIFNCGGLSVAFVFVTNWDISSTALVFSRVQKLKGQFGNLYVVVNLPTREQNDSFIQSYFRYGMEIGRPTFVPVQDLEMGFEKIVRIAHARRMCKQQDAVAQMKAERERSVQNMDTLLQVLTAIPGIDSHDANAMNQAIGSIQAISKSSKDHILEKTDLSAEKAETVTRFFRDPDYYLSTKIN